MYFNIGVLRLYAKFCILNSKLLSVKYLNGVGLYEIVVVFPRQCKTLDMPNANYKALQRQGRWQDLREVESYTADITVSDYADQLNNIAPI